MSRLADATGIAVRPLPWWLRAAARVAAVGGDPLELVRPERVLADAAAQAGLPPDYPPHVREALAVLWASLRDEARIHWFGAMNTRTLLVTGLAGLLRVERAFRDQPALADTPLDPPVVVTGLPRSGTTYLHRLLSAMPGAEPVRFYQHIRPAPPARLDLRRWRTELDFFSWRFASQAYGMDAIHHVRPNLPDECTMGVRLGGRSMLFWGTCATPGYLAWLLDQDLRETYALYRKVLILHQLGAPGRRLTLKCPHHLAYLPALLDAIPEARVVVTHRDPVETVPSEAKLVLSLQALSTHDLDQRRSVAANGRKLQIYAERAVAFADTAAGARAAHIPYRRLVADPEGVVRDIHGAFGLPFDAPAAARVRAFATENSQHRHGKNAYSAAQFGLDPARLAADFAGYRARFVAG